MNLGERASKRYALELWDLNALHNIEVDTTKGLREIYAHLFSDIDGYEAGQIRNIHLAKGHFRFASAMYLEDALTEKINVRTVYMNGIDQSYKYEAEYSINILEIDEEN